MEQDGSKSLDVVMNWLAHLHLSEPEVEFRLGNLLADQVRGADREQMSDMFRRGTACHQVIDAFAERHPVTQRSRQRILPKYRRFSGILVDVFYDHFLARDWEQFSPTPLAGFTQAVYADFRPYIPRLPAEASITLERIIEHDWLTSYRQLEGIEDVLCRLSRRLEERFQRPVPLGDATECLRTEYAAFEADFHDFFPELVAYLAESHPAIPVQNVG